MIFKKHLFVGNLCGAYVVITAIPAIPRAHKREQGTSQLAVPSSSGLMGVCSFVA